MIAKTEKLSADVEGRCHHADRRRRSLAYSDMQSKYAPRAEEILEVLDTCASVVTEKIASDSRVRTIATAAWSSPISGLESIVKSDQPSSCHTDMPHLGIQ